MKNWRSVFAALTVLYDSSIIVLCLAVGYAVSFPAFSFQDFFFHQWKLMLYTVVVYIGLGAMLGVYRQAYASPLRLQGAAVIRAYTLGTLLIFATLFLFKNTYYSNGALLTYVVIIPLGFLLSRSLFDAMRRMLQKGKRGLEPVVVVIVDDQAAEQLRHIAVSALTGFDVRAVIDVSHLDNEATMRRVREAIDRHQPLCVVYGASSPDSRRLSEFIDGVREYNIIVRLVTPEVHDTLARMRLYDFAGIAVSGPSRTARNVLYRSGKRMFDAALSALLILLIAPVLAVIALAIRLESRGGVFFRQMRSLSNGSDPVQVLKFRSMFADAEQKHDAFVAEKKSGDEAAFKSPGDPRITRVGSILRKYSLDELPQLFNVVAGDMSLVGPRPLPMADFTNPTQDATVALLYERRALVKPGLTGLWQISGRSRLNSRQMVFLDLYYAEHQSFLFDLEILFETIPVVISGRGAY